MTAVTDRDAKKRVSHFDLDHAIANTPASSGSRKTAAAAPCEDGEGGALRRASFGLLGLRGSAAAAAFSARIRISSASSAEHLASSSATRAVERRCMLVLRARASTNDSADSVLKVDLTQFSLVRSFSSSLFSRAVRQHINVLLQVGREATARDRARANPGKHVEFVVKTLHSQEPAPAFFFSFFASPSIFCATHQEKLHITLDGFFFYARLPCRGYVTQCIDPVVVSA